MKLLILADLHLDEYHSPEAVRQLGQEIREAGAEVDAMIIAGDMCELPSLKWHSCLGWLRMYLPDLPIHIIPGNHDYYGEEMREAEKAMSRICAEFGCHFAQMADFTVGEARILAATLWTDFGLFRAEQGVEAAGLAMRTARNMIPDYGYGSVTIGSPERPLRPKDTQRIHARHRAWLEGRLAEPHRGRTIVITHHAPSASVAGAPSALSPCFASDLDALIDAARPDAWIFGHTHRNAEVRAPGGTLLRNVSVGYEAEISPGLMRKRVRTGILDLETLDAVVA